MLLTGSKITGTPVLSLHTGGAIAFVQSAVIDPEDLRVIAYVLEGPYLKNNPDVGNILMTDDIREVSRSGLIVDSSDRFVEREEVIHLDEVMNLNFNLVGLKVVTQKDKKIGKISDYTLDSGTFSVYQLIVQRPFMAAFLDPVLTINRSQIIEIDDYKITIKHDKAQIKAPKTKAKEPASEDFTPNYSNPFRKPAYTDEDATESSSTTSE